MSDPKDNGGNGARPLFGHVVPAPGPVRPEHLDDHAPTLDEQRRRAVARALGMSPEERWPALLSRLAERMRLLTRLEEGAAAFRACYEGLPSHVHTRPVCANGQCDNLPRKDGLCNRCYEERQGEGGR